MAYSRELLQRVGPQNRGTSSVFTYTDTAVTLATIDTSGYFNNAADILKVGDWLLIRGSNGQAISYVSSNTRDLTANPPVYGVVDIQSAIATAAADSD